MKLLAATFAALILAISVGLAGQNAPRPRQTPSTPASIRNIVFAQRFTLETPYTNNWRKDRPALSSGTLIVAQVDPAYVVPRNALQPVLYAGNSTVIRLNEGYPSGSVIGIVPGNIDLTTAPVWFGTPELPERVTDNMIQAERSRAERAGVRAMPAERVSAAQRSAVTVKDLATLLRDVASQLVYEFSPQEKELADSWRLPDAKPTPQQPRD